MARLCTVPLPLLRRTCSAHFKGLANSEALASLSFKRHPRFQTEAQEAAHTKNNYGVLFIRLWTQLTKQLSLFGTFIQVSTGGKEDTHDPITREKRHIHKLLLKPLLHLRDHPLSSTISLSKYEKIANPQYARWSVVTGGNKKVTTSTTLSLKI